MAAKGQRIADIANRLEAAPGAAHDDRAIAEDAAEERLVDVHALDLVAVHLNRMPREQAGLVDHAVVGYRHFGRGASDKRAQRRRERQ